MNKNSSEYNTALSATKRLHQYCRSVGINPCMSHLGYGWFHVGLDKASPGADANLMSTKLKGLLNTYWEYSEIQGMENSSPGMMRETIHMGCPGEGDLKIVHFGSIGGKARTSRQTNLIAEVLGFRIT